MPLIADVNGQATLSTGLSKHVWASLQDDVRHGRQSVAMLPCGHPGIPKVSSLGTQFFAHTAMACAHSDAGSAGETMLHHDMKQQMLAGCAAAGWSARPEVAGPGWRADVLATDGAKRYAVEAQVQPQPLSEYKFRQSRYEAATVNAAWFTPVIKDVPSPRPDLPVFHVQQDGDALTATIGRVLVPLADAVRALLTGDAAFRERLDDGTGTQLEVVVYRSAPCWRCKQHYVLWHAEGEVSTGRCGDTAKIGEDRRRWDNDSPETATGVEDAVKQAAAPSGLLLARYEPKARSINGYFMIWSCPHCDAISAFTARHLARGTERLTSVRVPTSAMSGLPSPHWCLNAGQGLCSGTKGKSQSSRTDSHGPGAAPAQSSNGQ